MASPLELIATAKFAPVQRYTDMVKIYPQLLRNVNDMKDNPMPYLTGERPLIAGSLWAV